jgi:hypothetical protein
MKRHFVEGTRFRAWVLCGPCVVIACVTLLFICLGSTFGDDTKALNQTLTPTFVGDTEQLPKAVSRRLEVLSRMRLPHVEMHQALVNDVVSLIEAWLGGTIPIVSDRIDKPLTIETAIRELRIDYEAHNENLLKTVCLLTNKIGIDFAIRDDGTYILKPPPTNKSAVFRIRYVGNEAGHEVFKIERLK